MKILMIDNFDSFTHNLVQYFCMLGADVDVYRNNEIDCDAIKKLNPDAIVISPGPRTPKEAGISVPMIQKLYRRYPILGVCLGHQSLGAAFGAEIVRAPTVMHGKTSGIFHNNHPLFASIASPFIATRYHSLVIDPKTLPHEFEVIAEADNGVIMGVAHKSLPLYGIQFHPESILTPDGMRILKNFVGLVQSG